MGVKAKNLMRWQQVVPYTFKKNVNKTLQTWLEDHLKEFHKILNVTNNPIFVPKENRHQFNVEFDILPTNNNSCDLGCKSKVNQKFTLCSKAKQWDVFHELGHCLGAGHEQFHSRYPRRANLIQLGSDWSNFHAYAYKLKVNKYMDAGIFDGNSIMLYSSSNMGVSEKELKDSNYPWEKNDVYKVMSNGDKLLFRQLAGR